MNRLDQLLDELKQDYSPGDEDQARVKSAVLARVAQAGILGGLSLWAHRTWGLGLNAGASLSRSAGGKIVLAMVVGGGGVGGWALLADPVPSETLTGLPSHPVPGLAQPASASGAPDAPQSDLPPPNGVADKPSASRATTAPASADAVQAPGYAAAHPRGESHAPTTSAPSPTAAHGGSVDEIRGLSSASRAVREGRYAEAQRLLSVHRRAYPRTVLADERSALTWVVRCHQGAPAHSRAQGRAFAESLSSVALRDAVLKACAP